MTEGVTVNADVNVVIECSEVIDRPADAVWKAVRGLQAIMVPAGVTEQAESDMLPADDVPAQSLRASEQLSMEQRVAEIDDVLMLLRMEMTWGETSRGRRTSRESGSSRWARTVRGRR